MGFVYFAAMEQKESPLRIALIEDQVMFRDTMKAYIEGNTPHKVVLMAGDGLAYEQLCVHVTPPDVVIVDLFMPVRDGFETIAWITQNQPNTLPLACSFEVGAAVVRRALKAGSRGYLHKNCGVHELRDALEQLRTTGYYYTPLEQEHRAAMEAEERGRLKVLEALSPREMEVLQLACAAEELSYKGIGEKLGIERRTVESHIRNLSEKLGVTTRTGLVLTAFRWGLVG